MKLSLIIEAIARGRGIADSRRGLAGVNREAGRASGGLRQVDRGLQNTTRSANRLERAALGVGRGFGLAARRGIAGLSALDRRTRISHANAVRLAEWSGRKIGGGLRDGMRYGAYSATAAALAAGYKIVSAGLQFEKYRTQLRGLEGSEAAGERAMEWVTQFAARTPYELGDVMEAFVALKAYGIDPTDGSLRTLGDTAAGMGKPLMQAIEMIADAQTGEFERLKEFGIRASVAGEKVTFSFVRNGREMKRVAKKNAADIQRELAGIFNERFAGGMDRMAQTTEGKWSNMMDRMTVSAKRVWEGGLGTSVNREIDRFNAWIDKLEKDGSLQKWADETGEGLGDFVSNMAAQDWEGIGQDIRTFGGAIGEVARALRALDEARQSVRDFDAWVARMGASMGGVRLVNGGLGGLRYVPPSEMPANRQSREAAVLRGTARDTRGEFSSPGRVPYVVRNDPRQDLGGAFSGAGRRRPATMAPPRRPASNGATSPATARPGNAKISLHVTTDPGVRARPTAVAAKGVDVSVETGRAMRGAA